jgi:hypothetical protein
MGKDLHGFDMLKLLPVKREKAPHSISDKGRQGSPGLRGARMPMFGLVIALSHTPHDMPFYLFSSSTRAVEVLNIYTLYILY